jgi:hypothetical protein
MINTELMASRPMNRALRHLERVALEAFQEEAEAFVHLVPRPLEVVVVLIT